jgi:hypothetical protein
MASRPPPRLIFISIAAVFFLLYFLFHSQGPESPAVRAPGHLEKSIHEIVVDDDILKGDVMMPKLANETAREELGRATWKFFHTMMARYPEKPTKDEQEALRSFVYLFSRLYPCGECASHFQDYLKKYPPQVSSRNAAAGWACFIHNEVNDMLKKPTFDCNALGDFYDCGCGDDENDKSRTGKEEGEKRNRESHEQKKVDTATNDGKDAFPLVEITKEPPTRGG